MEFKNYKREKVDLFQHCLEQRILHKDLTVFIGTDSITTKGEIVYFTVIAFRYGKNGAHFIFSKEKVPSYRFGNGKPDILTKLRREYNLTLDLAELLVKEKVFERDQIIIEFDYNNLVETISTKIIGEARGMATYLGFQSLTKGETQKVIVNLDGSFKEINDQIAVKAADHLCQGVK